MEMSPAIDQLATALATAQAGLGKLIASKTVEVQTRKGRDYTYTYADLGQALEVCRPTLNENGIAIIQLPATPTGNGIEVRTMLAHASGQWMQSDPLFMPVQGGAQDVGSAITYARRYQLLAMVGLAPEDDDGAAAQAAKPVTWIPPGRSTRERDAVGPRCRGKLEPIANTIEGLMRDISDGEGLDMGEVWDRLLDSANVDLDPYVQADGNPPQTAFDLGRPDGDAMVRVARGWLAELARG